MTSLLTNVRQPQTGKLPQSCYIAHLNSAKCAVIFYRFCNPPSSQNQTKINRKHFYFDRVIRKSSKGVTDEEKCKNCAAVIKCTGGSTSSLLRHLKSKHSIEKPSSTQ